MKTLRVFKQLGPGYCGLACCQTALDYFGIEVNQKMLVSVMGLEDEASIYFGVSPETIVSLLSKSFGLEALTGNRTPYDFLTRSDDGLVLVVYQKEDHIFFEKEVGHYSIVADCDESTVVLADPENGYPDLVWHEREEFEHNWWDASVTGVMYDRWALKVIKQH